MTLEEGQKICPAKKKIPDEIKHCCKRLFVNGTVNQVIMLNYTTEDLACYGGLNCNSNNYIKFII